MIFDPVRLALGGLRCQYRRQTNGPLATRCPCVMVLEKKKKNFCRPLKCAGPRGKYPMTNPALLEPRLSKILLGQQNHTDQNKNRHSPELIFKVDGCGTVFWRNKYVNLCFLNICKIWWILSTFFYNTIAKLKDYVWIFNILTNY